MRRYIMLMSSLFLIAVLGAASAQSDTQYAYTYQQSDGNRIVEGSGNFPTVESYVTQLSSGTPLWIVGTATDNGYQFVVTTQSGGLEIFDYDTVDQTLSPMLDEAGLFWAGRPPLLAQTGENIDLIIGTESSSSLSHPVPTANGYWLEILNTGDLALTDGTRILQQLPLGIQADARIVDDGSGERFAVYTNATNQRYVHDIMGDDLEGASLVMFSVLNDDLQPYATVNLDNDDIFEGLSPIWADVDGNGIQDVITTISNGTLGAQVVVFNQEGQRIAEGPPIGRGFRWRHQLAWGAFGDNGEIGMIEVLTPHIGGRLGFFVYEDGQLVRTAATDGYTSHIINSRNLDMATAGDFNGDGQLEIVLPNQQRDRLVGLQIEGDQFIEVWSFDLEGQVISNVFAIDSQALAVGTTSDLWYLWVSE